MIRPGMSFTLATLAVGAAAVVYGCSVGAARAAPSRAVGAPAPVGNGTAAGFAEFDKNGAPQSIGLAFSAEALEALPSVSSDGHHCFDHNADGRTDPAAECFATHERVVLLPEAVAARDDIPFKWVLLNWNPGGHIPPGVYDVPHFDVHFYIDRIENTFAISPGPCGPEFVRCDQFEAGQRPLPANYTPPGFSNVGAVVPAMGNHLIDTTGPEFRGTPFTRTWIYGVYDGKVTFYEEMLTLAYLRNRPNECTDIRTAPAVGLTGYYPTRSCVRYDAERDEYTVSLEGFVHRKASPPDPVAAAAEVSATDDSGGMSH